MSRGPHVTAQIKWASEFEIAELVHQASRIARRHGISVRAVLNLGVSSVTKARVGAEPLDFIPVGDA